jgi:hypothetical protein
MLGCFDAARAGDSLDSATTDAIAAATASAATASLRRIAAQKRGRADSSGATQALLRASDNRCVGRWTSCVAVACAAALVTACGSAARDTTPAAGGRIAYSTEGGRIAVSDATGHGVRYVGEGAVAAISPDGRMLAVYRQLHSPDGPALFLRNIGTGAETLVSDHAFAPVVWSPDGRKLLFTKSSSLIVCTTSRTRCHAVAHDTSFGYAFSPDSRSIAFATGSRTSAESPAGSVVVLSPGKPAKTLPFDTLWLWTPAGLVLGRVPDGHPQTVWVRQGDGRTRVLFTGTGDMPLMVPRDISPDGTNVLYEAMIGCGPLVRKPQHGYVQGWTCYAPEVQLEIGSIQGGLPRLLSSHYARGFSSHFSPDGSAVIAGFERSPGPKPIKADTHIYLGVLPLGSTTPRLGAPLLHYAGTPSVAR